MSQTEKYGIWAHVFVMQNALGYNWFIKQAKCDLNVTHERDLSVQKAPW